MSCWHLQGALIHVQSVAAVIAAKVEMLPVRHASECRVKPARGWGFALTPATECMCMSVQDAQTMEIKKVCMQLSW
jgi:hypothetical protein